MIESVREDCKGLEYEFVIVDSSDDRTWLREQKDVLLIEQERLGAVTAFNTGFCLSRGAIVINLNDDCFLYPTVIPHALEMFNDPAVGQVAFPFSEPGFKGYRTIRVQGRDYLYANFGAIRHTLGVQFGWWGNYKFYSGDTHLSMKVWQAGFRVEPLKCSGWVEHQQIGDLCQESGDCARFFDYWNEQPLP